MGFRPFNSAPFNLVPFNGGPPRRALSRILLKIALTAELQRDAALSAPLQRRAALAADLQRSAPLITALLRAIQLSGPLDRTVRLSRVYTTKADMAKPKTVDILGYRSGDAFELDITVTNWPTDDPATKIYCTVKRSLSDADGSAICQRVVTGSPTSHGQILTPGSDGTLTAVVQFDKDTSALILPDKVYEYDVRVISADGDPEAVFDGKIKMKKTATDASS